MMFAGRLITAAAVAVGALVIERCLIAGWAQVLKLRQPRLG